MKLRKIALTLHSYVGVFVGLVLIVICVTGSLLVFQEELERFFHPHLLQVIPQGKPVALESVRRTVQAAYPDLKLHQIVLPKHPDGAFQVWMQSESDRSFITYVNPYSGAILGSRPWDKTIGGFLIDLHVHFLAGEIGMQMVGICGLLLLLLCITGLLLWPGWKKLTVGLKIRWKAPGKLIHYDLHKVSGIVSVAFLLVIAFTGAAMIFWQPFEGAVHWLTQTPPAAAAEPISKVVAGKKPLSVDELLRKSNEALPGAKNIKIYLPKAPKDTFSVRKKLPSEILPYGQSYVYLDQYSGKVLRVENALKASLPTRIMNLMYPLHIGHYGGVLMRLIYVLAGFIPVLLTITGLVLWQQRQWAVARRQAAIRQHQEFFPTTQQWPWF